eukprot:COSAG04_NODE_134_length_23866_cov_4.802036_1_plen_97_part_10
MKCFGKPVQEFREESCGLLYLLAPWAPSWVGPHQPAVPCCPVPHAQLQIDVPAIQVLRDGQRNSTRDERIRGSCELQEPREQRGMHAASVVEDGRHH